MIHLNLEPTDSSQILGQCYELILLSSGFTDDNPCNDLELLKSYLLEQAFDIPENIPTGELYRSVDVMWIERKGGIAYTKRMSRVLPTEGL